MVSGVLYRYAGIMREFTVSSKNEDVRLSRFIEKAAPSLPKSAMYRAIRTKKIKLNGKRCKPDDRLHEGDIVQMWIDDSSFESRSLPDFMRASKNLEIIYEDENAALLYKPAGLNSHPSAGEYNDNLIARFLRYLYEKGEYVPSEDIFTPALCNRLDRNTSGIVVAGKSHEAVNAVNSLIRDGNIIKTYLAVTAFRPPADGTYTAYLRKDGKRNIVTVRDDEAEGWQEIVTGFRTLDSRNGLWLLECTLFTGRTHQIRAHLSHLNAPILGDTKYGDSRMNSRYGVNRQLLTAYSISFPETYERSLSGLSGKTFCVPEIPFRDLFPDTVI